MIVIEAVDTACWNAITGSREIVTVEECGEELQRGDPSMHGYVQVRERDIARAIVRPLPVAADITFRLQYPDAYRLDPGERDLLALACTLSDDFALCSCDRAAVGAAHALGWLDRVVSLQALATSLGVRPCRPFKRQYTERQLEIWRTSLLLEAGP
ncbi:MAG: hypothetical protein OXI39_01620 [Gemmatimonadota bacterium]|uniref:hypothetical protein n=1 Tax=Candidatus Palauibacter scopulicola TaxID=3056741 RepID=UPI00238AF789|nr:hypothetical protein [Candidatus Palauibacter scopulicola]MDE2661688.1 hypothetical protein [Candidatus Palauibacter scopulicola]